MATEQDTVIATLDAKIAELQATLDALRRTRAFFVAERGRGDIAIADTPVHAEDERSGQPQLSTSQPTKSIGMMILDILHDSGRPIHVDELIPRLRAKGSQASRATILGTLSRYKTDGKLRRVAQNTYALKKLRPHEQNTFRPPLEEANNGATAKLPMQPGTQKHDCYTVLKDRGAFMTPHEIYEVLSERGKTFNAKNPIDQVGWVMRKSIRRNGGIFTRGEAYSFGLQEWQNSQVPLAIETGLEPIHNNSGNNVNVDSFHE